MKGLKRIIYCLIVSCFFCACKNNGNKEGTFIPPLPNDTEFSKQTAAIKILSDEIRKNSSNDENYYKRAKIYFELNNLENANSDLNEAFSLNENDGRYRLLKSEILRAEGKFQKALEEAKVAEILGLKTPEVYTILGDLSQKNNQNAEAKKFLKYAMELAPFNGEVYYYTALLNVKEGDTTAAIDNYNLAKQFKPRFINTYKRLSEIYNNQGNTDLAMEMTMDLAKLYPNDAENCSILAKIYRRRANLDSAIIFYKKAITLKPNMYQVSYDAGMMCLRNNYFEEALKFFENTYKFAPKTAFINTNLAMCYESLGNTDKAYEYYTIAFAVNRSDYKAIEGIKRMEEKIYYVQQPANYTEIFKQPVDNKPKVDTNKIRLIEIQPKKLSSPKRDSTNSKLQIPNKFTLPTIK